MWVRGEGHCPFSLDNDISPYACWMMLSLLVRFCATTSVLKLHVSRHSAPESSLSWGRSACGSAAFETLQLMLTLAGSLD